MQRASQAVVRVDRSEDTHLVALGNQLAGELIDVAGDPSWKSPGIWANKRDTHWAVRC
jgi:hypothetical protein